MNQLRTIRTRSFWWGVGLLSFSVMWWVFFAFAVVEHDLATVQLALPVACSLTGIGIWCVRRGIKRVVAGEGVPPAGEQVIYERKVALHSWTLGSRGPGTRWLRLTPQSIFIEEEPEIPLASIKSCEIKSGPYVNLQFADSLGKTKRVKLFIPALFSSETGPQVEEVYDRIMRARGGGKVERAKSSTSRYPTPKDVYLYLLSKYEAEGGERVTFQHQQDEKIWVQALFSDEETSIIFSYPNDEDPNQLISKLGITFPSGYVLLEWEGQLYAIFAGPKCSHSELAQTIDELFTKLLGTSRNYVVDGWIE